MPKNPGAEDRGQPELRRAARRERVLSPGWDRGREDAAEVHGGQRGHRGTVLADLPDICPQGLAANAPCGWQGKLLVVRAPRRHAVPGEGWSAGTRTVGTSWSLPRDIRARSGLCSPAVSSAPSAVKARVVPAAERKAACLRACPRGRHRTDRAAQR